MKYIPKYTMIELSGAPIILIALGAAASCSGFLLDEIGLLTFGIALMIFALPLMYRAAYMQCGCYLAPRDTDDSAADVTVLPPDAVDFVIARLNGTEMLRLSLDCLISIGDKPKEKMRMFDYSFVRRRAVTLVFSEAGDTAAVKLDLPKDGEIYAFLSSIVKQNRDK